MYRKKYVVDVSDAKLFDLVLSTLYEFGMSESLPYANININTVSMEKYYRQQKTLILAMYWN